MHHQDRLRRRRCAQPAPRPRRQFALTVSAAGRQGWVEPGHVLRGLLSGAVHHRARGWTFGTTCSTPSTDEQFCSPDLTPSPTTPPQQSGPVTIDCVMGYVNIPAGSGVAVQEKKFQLTPPKPDTADGYSLSDYEAMQISITVNQDTTINSVTVIWYGSSDEEISSGTVDIGQLIAAGQTLTYVYDESMGSDPQPSGRRNYLHRAILQRRNVTTRASPARCGNAA